MNVFLIYLTEFSILGLENQASIHYGMPLRNMLYDALDYHKEFNAITQKNKRESLTSSEFLSGFKKTDRLHPVFTIVLYYNDLPWDGPTSLKDMMIPMPSKLSECFFDYPMRLIQIPDTKYYHFRNPDVEAVFDILRLIYDRNYEELREKYERKNIDNAVLEAVSSISAVTLKSTNSHGKEETNMWASLKEWRQEGYISGQKHGYASGISHSRQEIITQMLKNQLDIDFIHQVTNIPLDEIKEVQKAFVSK